MVKLVKVNKKDEEIGLEDKLKCHLGKGILHRAFTVLIFNSKNELLIQKRSKDKFLWPLVWEASCSSHPLRNESYIYAGKKRLKKELGFECDLKFLDKFQYRTKYKNIGSEYELCALLIGRYNGKVKPNKKEVADYKWIGLEQLKKDILKKPKEYAPWLEIALRRFKKNENRK